jgi:predicted amidophosphoribosyltransferase
MPPPLRERCRSCERRWRQDGHLCRTCARGTAHDPAVAVHARLARKAARDAATARLKQPPRPVRQARYILHRGHWLEVVWDGTDGS